MALLEKYGHIGRSALELCEKGTQDASLFQKVQLQKALFLTTDKDFFHTVPSLFKDHAGIVVIAIHQPNRQKILQRLEWVLRWLKQGRLAGRVLLVTEYHHLVSP